MASFFYCQGYQDALIDLIDWFDSTERKDFLIKVKKNRKLIHGLLNAFLEHRMQFMKLKTEFNLQVFIPNDKKKKPIIKHINT